MLSPLYSSRMSTAMFVSMLHSSAFPLSRVMFLPRKWDIITIVKASGSLESFCISSIQYLNCFPALTRVLATQSCGRKQFLSYVVHFIRSQIMNNFNCTCCRYRLGTVNSKSFVCKVLLQIKWKFE